MIGATDECRRLLEPYAKVGHIGYHPTAEDALYALIDAAENGVPVWAPAEVTSMNEWPVHVAYGPDAYGALASGAEARLQHTGHTFVLGLDVHEAPSAIRMRGAVLESDQPDNLIWQAAVVAGADMLVDLTSPEALAFMANYLHWKEA